MDEFAVDEPYSRLYLFNERASNQWTFNEHLFVVPAICVWQNPSESNMRLFVALSENGQLIKLGAKTKYENIADAGLSRPGAAGYGYLMGLKQIGKHLYVCGFAGQALRRDESGDWQHIDHGLLQNVGMSRGGYVVQAIDGPSENSIYVAGSVIDRGIPPRADFFDGRSWRSLALPPNSSRLTCIFVESADRIWMGGDNGTLLFGNATTGFRSFGPVSDRMLITSIALFGNKGYIATQLGLFSFHPNKVGSSFTKVRTGLKPELRDSNVVQAIDGVLWSFGPKDLARFDGVRWERVQHPDNHPVSI